MRFATTTLKRSTKMLPTSLLVLVALAVFSISSVRAFVPNSILRNKCRPSTSLDMSLQDVVTSHLPRILSTIQLADTSISEEEVLNTIGQAGDLPDPFFTVLVAGVIVLGVAVLQFSLGDLTKEEGQARVRDFLQTRKDTERKRGYFD